jgi:hypothetical protein
MKLDAFSTLPYTWRATDGYGHKGRVRSGAQSAGTSAFTPPGLPGPRALATIRSGSLPRSTQLTKGVM